MQVLLLTPGGPVLAYDGPSPTTYDKTISTIRVVMTTQGKILEEGLSRFSLVAHVPIPVDAVGEVVDVEIRGSSAAGTSTLARCTFVPQRSDIGTTVAIPCNRDIVVPPIAGGGPFSIYPYVLRRSYAANGQKVHDGSTFKVPVSVVSDDAHEDNDSSGRPTALGLINSVLLADRVSRDADYYRFTVPADLEMAEIDLRFWHDAGDLDLWVYDASGQVAAVSDGYDDRELVVIPVVPGDDYLVRVVNFSDTPAFYNLEITNRPATGVSIASGPTGTPNPATPGEIVSLTAEAIGGDGGQLSFEWNVVCPGLSSSGLLSGSTRSVQWSAPANGTGVQQACEVTVTARNGTGESDSASYLHYLDPSPDAISVVAGPSGVPDPVPSQGTVALGVSAVDPLGHPLSYEWRVYCPWTFATGLLSDAFAQYPTWQAPVNSQGVEMSCTIEVTIVDAFHHSTSASYGQRVAPADTVTVVTGPTGIPNPVASGASAVMSASAVDSHGHPVDYRWSASCPAGPSGSFVPSAEVQNPTWLAPTNVTGVVRSCTLTVRAADAFGNSQTRTTSVVVNSIPDEVMITAIGSLTGTGPVASAASVPVAVTASDSIGHPLSSTWQATCPGLSASGTFALGPAGMTATWTAPANFVGAARSCLLEATVRDAFGTAASASFEQVVDPAPHTLSFTHAPDGTPDAVASEGTVETALGVVDSYTHGLSFEWSASCPGLSGPGAFVPSHLARTPSWTAPSNATGALQACTLEVTVRDTEGLVLRGSIQVTVDLANDVVTITSGPSSTPSNLPSGGLAHLAVGAEDTYGHPLALAWRALCPGLAGAPGTFDSASSPTPSWTAPENRTGTEQTCTISVTATDTFDHHATATVGVRVASVPDVISVEAGPSGSDESVPSGAVVPLGLTATDSVGHTLQYLWWGSCPALGSSGTFVPGSNVSQPAWTAPVNRTGSEQSCTLSVKIADGRGNSVTRSFVQRLQSVPHTLELTQGPSATPAIVASRGVVELRATVSDSLLHHVERRWEASCPAPLGLGSFTPFYEAMLWNAPANLSGTDQTCALTLTATDGTGESITAVVSILVRTAIDEVTITSGPASSANPVPSGGVITLSVTAVDPYDHPLRYDWSASCAGGVSGEFLPSASMQGPTWRAPVDTTGVELACTIDVTITDGHHQAARGSLALSVQRANTITITLGPGTLPVTAEPGSTLPLSAGAVDTLGRPLTYAWTAACPGLPSNGSFTGAAGPTPLWRVPANVTGGERTCSITLVVTDTNGERANRSFDVQVPPQNTVSIASPAAARLNPLESGGSTQVRVTATDTQGRTLTYLWSSTCPGLPSSGLFDDPTSATPLWTAPVNRTGADVTCTLLVTVTNDQGLSRTSTLAQTVQTLPQSLTFAAGPNGTPNPVASGGSVLLSAAASDVWGRPLTFAWTAACPTLGASGSFDRPSSTAPRWTAPTNSTSGPQACTLTITVSDDRGNTSARPLAVTVGSALQITVTSTVPGGNPNGVSPGSSVGLSAGSGTLPGQTLTYLWTAVCPGLGGNGAFTSPTTQATTWVPPAHANGPPQTCRLTLTATDGQGQVSTASLNVVVQSGPFTACTITVSTQRLEVPIGGGRADVVVSAQDGCQWNATTTQSWIHLMPGGTGTGLGTISLQVDPTSVAGPRVGTLTISGLDVQVVQAGLGYTYYLAEGATVGGFFDTRIALLNPDLARPAAVTVEFQLKDTSTVLVHTLGVGAHQRATIDLKTLGAVNPALSVLSSAECSTVVRSDLPLVVDRTMTWDGRAYGGHSETAVDAPASTWYFAEGATIGAFELYLLIQNPNPVPLDNELEVTYLLPPPAAPIVRTYSMGTRTRRNIAVHLEPGLENAEVSAIIRTPHDKPVIAERAMYLTTGDLFYGAGHESAGIRTPRTQWFFAEGATGDFFDLFILIGNPNDEAARVTATFLFDDGTTCSKAIGNMADGGATVVGPRSRQNVWVDLEVIPGCPRSLAHAAVSTTISSDLPIVAERSMWWPGPTAATWAEAHNSPGATDAGTLWAMADGEQGGSRGVETYVLVANTSAFDGRAKVTLYFEDGTSVEKQVELLANSRATVPIGAGRDPERQSLDMPERAGFGFGPLATDRRFGVVVESVPAPGQVEPARIVVERATYWNAPGAPLWGAGTNALGTRLQ